MGVTLLVAVAACGATYSGAAPLEASTTGIRTVAFTDGGALYLVREDGSGRVALTPRVRFTNVDSLAWSPNGRWIAFNSRWENGEPGGGSALRIVSPDGRFLRTLVRGYVLSQPAWSPDGKRIAYCDLASKGHSAIFRISADGTGRHLLIKNARSPAWSPDGRRLAFLQHLGFGEAVVVANIDGTGVRRLASTPGDLYTPQWSPDGNSILFGQMQSPENGQTAPLFIVNADGRSALRRLVGSLSQAQYAWNPRGGSVAFRCSRAGSDRVCSVDARTGTVKTLTMGFASASWPTWSPDGNRIALLGCRTNDRCSAVFVMTNGGAHAREIAPSAFALYDRPLAWKPTS